MSAKPFLDTNIIAYAFDHGDDQKRTVALNLIKPQAPWQISWQVVQEFSSVGLHKFKTRLTSDYLEDLLEHLLWPHCHTFPSPALYSKATRLHGQTQYRFYDCLIVAAALESNAEILYSEDLQHDRTFGHLRIVNPFL